MPLKTQCPTCHKALTVPDQLAGRTGKCPGCGTSVSIPPLPPPPFQQQSAASFAFEPLVATIVHDAPSPPPAGGGFARLNNRSWKFWAASAVGCIAGLYFLSMMLALFVPAIQNAITMTRQQADAESSTGETALDRMGHVRHQCLICGSGRSPTARSRYGDQHGFGLCEFCGPRQEAAARLAAAGGSGTYADQQAAQQLMQTIQQHVGSNPSDTQGVFYLTVLSSFDSPEWNSLYGPVK